jgi:hypothetical protein
MRLSLTPARRALLATAFEERELHLVGFFIGRFFIGFAWFGEPRSWARTVHQDSFTYRGGVS